LNSIAGNIYSHLKNHRFPYILLLSIILFNIPVFIDLVRDWILIITGLSLYYLGKTNFRKVWFSFFFLLFMIPIPAIIYYSATLPMQLLASKVTDNLLQLIGVPSVRQGNIIYLTEYTLEVAEACSGLRSLTTIRLLFTAIGAYAVSVKLAEDFLHELSGMMVFISALIIIIILGAFLKLPEKRT